MRTLFYGTPAPAVPFLELLAARTSLAAVVCRPDRPSGRGLATAPSPVKSAAARLGLETLQPESPSAAAARLRELSPDLAVAVAYGRILKADLLAVPRLGTLNVHFSLLPAYRGAAPVQWALARGERRTGVTVFWLDEGMDTGPVQDSEAADILPGEDAPALLERLTRLGVGLLSRVLDDVAAGRIRRAPQEGAASLAPVIKREDARLDLSRPPGELEALVRAFRGWPRAWLEASSGRLLVLRALPAEASDPPATGAPGRVLSIERGRGVLVECGSRGRLWFLEVQPEGKKPLHAADFANGRRLAAGGFLVP